MSTDPIKLIRQITEPKTTTAAKPPEPPKPGAEPAAKAAPAAASNSAAASKANAMDTLKAQAAASTKANAVAGQAKDYVLSQSLKSKISTRPGDQSGTPDLASANATEIQNYYEGAAKARKAEAASGNKTGSTDTLLSETKGATGVPGHSFDAQQSLRKMAATKEDAAMKAIDPRLANILGVSKIIGTA
ncbi:MAG: hypothetical protein IPK50_22845 [Fibrobacterota bacterium]|nr:MAG: hypothetical protein IPK50_22845 [Fibrobacterota bacterium]